jgi:hypothetical protein
VTDGEVNAAKTHFEAKLKRSTPSTMVDAHGHLRVLEEISFQLGERVRKSVVTQRVHHMNTEELHAFRGGMSE